MMIAQLKHQDPMNPMDGTAFTAQLAQFSSLEQLQNINTQLTSFTKQQQSLGNSAGREPHRQGSPGQGRHGQVDGNARDLRYKLTGDAVSGQIRIYDANGQLVDALLFKNQKQGLNTVTWNCPSSAKGSYTFEVSALTAPASPSASTP